MTSESKVPSRDRFRAARERADRPLLTLLYRYGRSHAMWFLGGALAQFVREIPRMFPPFLLGIAFDAIFVEGQSYALPLVPQAWIPNSPMGQVWLTFWLYLAAELLASLITWIQTRTWSGFSQKVQHDVRTDTYDVMQRLELGFFDDQQTGKVMSILNNDVNQLEAFLTSGVNQAINIVSYLLWIGIYMAILNWQLALVAFVAAPAIAILNYWFSNVIEAVYEDVRESVGTVNARIENNVSGIDVIKSYTNEPFELERVDDASMTYRDANLDAITIRSKHGPTMWMLTGLGFTLTVAVGGYWVIEEPPLFFSGTLTAGLLIPYLYYTRGLMWTMRSITSVVDSAKQARASAARIVGLQTAATSVPEREDATDLETVAGEVEYDNVTFSYARGDGPTLEGITFAATAGETVGIVGPTGAGKTTLVKLLLRLYDVEGGTIRVDGTDIRDVSLESLRESIGYVSQDPFLFYGTVRENITYGTSEMGDERVVRAAKRAGAHEFVTDLPDGYDTIVGERGQKLSGGQRQRISLARALVREPSILILDEATSHVDNETEVRIQRHLERATVDITMFVVAHRLSTVRDADRILVMDDGKLVEEASHDELIERDGLYANLWRVQVGQVESLSQEFLDRVASEQI